MTHAPELYADPDAQYVPSHAVADVAMSLIASQDRFRQLDDFRIAYLERLGDPTGEGEDVLAKVQKAGPLWRDLAHVDAVVWVWQQVWGALSPREREALIAHELCHLDVTDTGKLKVRKHDLEEFAWIARRYGPWMRDIARFAEQLQAFEAEREANVVPMTPRPRRPRGGSKS